MKVGNLVRVLIGDTFGEDFIPAGSCGLVIEEWEGASYDKRKVYFVNFLSDKYSNNSYLAKDLEVINESR